MVLRPTKGDDDGKWGGPQGRTPRSARVPSPALSPTKSGSCDGQADASAADQGARPTSLTGFGKTK
jgi:hypothetical protein